MADSTPLLVEDPVSLDSVIEQSLTDLGWNQLIQAILVGLASFFDSQQTFVAVYTDLVPKWHCKDPIICDPDICKLPRSAWVWDGLASRSVISDWGLECSSSFTKGLPTSAFYMGCVIGGFILATIPDSFCGRKKLLLISCLTMSVTGALTVMSPNIWVYSFLKFVSGFGRSLVGTYMFVLLTERVGSKWRARAGMIPFTLFVLGFLSLPAIAYANRNSSWRILYLYVSLPTICYCLLLHFFVLESPRWLFMQGRREEALSVFKKIATSTSNHTRLDDFFSDLPYNYKQGQGSSRRINYSIKDLFSRNWAFRRILAAMLIAFGIGMSYYGIPYAIGSLSVNLYIGEAVNALIELPSFVLAPIILERFNRRSSLLGVNLIGGVSGIVCAIASSFGGERIAIFFELTCFFCARMGFNVIIVYTVEMFPTCVRNSATTMVRQALVIGAVFSPVLVSLGRSNPFLSYGVFGLVSLVFGTFVFFLQETKGLTLSDTMEEQEEKEKLVG